MKNRYLRLGGALATAVLLLAACGGGGGVNPDPQPGVIAGTVHAAPATGLYSTVVLLCEAGSSCSTDSSVLRQSAPINTGGQSAPFAFSNLPEGVYDLVAEAPSGPEPTTPPSHYQAVRTNVNTGSTGVDLHLDLWIADPTDDSAALTGILYLPGSIGSASVGQGGLMQAAAGQLPAITASSLMPAGDILFGASNDLGAGRGSPIVPGELVVAFRNDVLFSQSSLGTLNVDGVQLQHIQGTPGGQHLYQAAGLNAQQTLALAERLRQRPDVLRAAPNRILHSFAAPTDDLYPLQWHYDVINMEEAWEIETGSTGMTVAVVDTGSISGHPDLSFTGGYDFISTAGSAGDGGGRDNDPTDEGQNSNYHGAHVAGTIGATSNNTGVAGVNWDVTLVPVRVLGRDGNGTMLDILDGITWAAGGSVGGVPDNVHPAQVVNLSLGASVGMSCSEVLGGPADFFTTLGAETGAIFVVAAGNEDISTNGVFPANCPGVITVGATGQGNERAPYSNHGAAVDVMGPGGDLTASFSSGGNDYAYGVLSTVLDNSGAPAYAFFQGTSMATPHVAGVVALMLAAEPGLSHATVLARLQGSISDTVCASGCGAGLIDAAAALAAGDTGTPPPPPPPEPPTPGEAMTYILFSQCDSADCSSYSPTQIAGFDNAPAGGVRYIIHGLQPGQYRVEGWIDLDSGTVVGPGVPTVIDIDPDEPYGLYPDAVTLQANRTTRGVDIHISGAF